MERPRGCRLPLRRGHKLTFGAACKDKSRDYTATRFYYDLDRLSPQIDDIYDTDGYLNFANVANGSLVIDRQQQPKDSYDAGNTIAAVYASVDLKPTERLLINAGLRLEMSKQWVDYANDQSIRQRRNLDKSDLFPALNLRYSLGERQQLRLALSRTVTRPSFIEMAPFLYQESYGSVQLRGNEELVNSYNYNVDLRYELLNRRGDMISVTGYYKFLDEPIERVQMLSGGAAVHTFRNADNGMAAGIEVEVRKSLTETLRIGANGTYMYTNVTLPDGGAYTNKERALQGLRPTWSMPTSPGRPASTRCGSSTWRCSTTCRDRASMPSASRGWATSSSFRSIRSTSRPATASTVGPRSRCSSPTCWAGRWSSSRRSPRRVRPSRWSATVRARASKWG